MHGHARSPAWTRTSVIKDPRIQAVRSLLRSFSELRSMSEVLYSTAQVRRLRQGRRCCELATVTDNDLVYERSERVGFEWIFIGLGRPGL